MIHRESGTNLPFKETSSQYNGSVNDTPRTGPSGARRPPRIRSLKHLASSAGKQIPGFTDRRGGEAGGGQHRCFELQ